MPRSAARHFMMVTVVICDYYDVSVTPDDDVEPIARCRHTDIRLPISTRYALFFV